MVLLLDMLTAYPKVKILMFGGRQVELGRGGWGSKFYENKRRRVCVKSRVRASSLGETGHAWNDPPVVIYLLARFPCRAISLDVHLQPDAILQFLHDPLRAVVVDAVDTVSAIGHDLYSTPPLLPRTVAFCGTVIFVYASIAVVVEGEGEEQVENVWRQGLFERAEHETGGDACSQRVLDVVFPFVGA